METNQWAMFKEGFLSQLHKPGENKQLNDKLKEAHLAATGGKVVTRFPPEPNGHLHIGHSKAIAVNFGYAAYHNGKCYLRYDDTNPDAEEEIFYDSILQAVRWLSFEPYKVTYSSDNFDKLYELAVELIKRDKAYVCHQTDEEMREYRGGPKSEVRKPSPFRDRNIEESLKEFERMKNGEYDRGQATLRLKQDLNCPNPYMWDVVAYRIIKENTHHRTGNDWCMYPTYDFTHCLCDSLENISHSLCTTEFIPARQSYDWVCNTLEVYRPQQSEYGKLEIQGTVLSKRRLKRLVEGQHVSGWNDPRLYTLIALRRRGVPPGAILSFISQLGVTTARAIIPVSRFEQSVRQYLEHSSPRLNLVLNPIKLVIENLPDNHVEFVEKPLHPKIPEMGTVRVPFTNTVYIDASDFKEQDEKGYFRLAPGKTVGLLNAPAPVLCNSYEKDPKTGTVTLIRCTIQIPSEGENPKKPKGWIHWVAEHKESASPVVIDETRIFHRLFKSEDPSVIKDTEEFIADLNKDSLEVVEGAMLDVGFWNVARKLLREARFEAQKRIDEQENTPEAKEASAPPPAKLEDLVGSEVMRFQGNRTAYFTLDSDTSLTDLVDVETDKDDDFVFQKRDGDRLVVNRIVSLKEDAAKK